MAQTDSASIHKPAWRLKLGTGGKRDGNLTSAPQLGNHANSDTQKGWAKGNRK